MLRLDETTIATLAGMDGASFPFFSPDGASVGFFASEGLYQIYVIYLLPDGQPAGGKWQRLEQPYLRSVLCDRGRLHCGRPAAPMVRSRPRRRTFHVTAHLRLVLNFGDEIRRRLARVTK